MSTTVRRQRDDAPATLSGRGTAVAVTERHTPPLAIDFQQRTPLLQRQHAHTGNPRTSGREGSWRTAIDDQHRLAREQPHHLHVGRVRPISDPIDPEC